jgi:hypothetical protein
MNKYLLYKNESHKIANSEGYFQLKERFTANYIDTDTVTDTDTDFLAKRAV